MLRLAILIVVCAIAEFAFAGAREIRTIVLPVADIERSAAFYEQALGFTRAGRALRLGQETIELEARAPRLPAGGRSNDLWFQHFAIVVRDMDRAYERVRGHAHTPISSAPQTLPGAGIRAYKFRDPDDHPLELLFFPPGEGDPRWQTPGDALFLGIDHTAIAVSDSERSLAFYRDLLGFTVTGRGVNAGPTQSALDSVADPIVRIVGLRPARDRGPGLEFLHYLRPGDGRIAPRSGARTRVVVEVDRVAPLAARLARHERLARGILVHDPDGHAVVLID